MNRRNFFGNLGLILTAASAPTLFIPTEHVNWGKPILYVPKTYKLKVMWSVELEQDLWAYHGINVEKVRNQEIAERFPGQQPLRIEMVKSDYDPINWMPRYHHLVTINERVS